MDQSLFLGAVLVSLVLLYSMRELRKSLGKISTDIQDLKSVRNTAAKPQD